MKRSLVLILISFVSFEAALLAQTCAPIPSSYTLTVLPSLGGDYSLATAINSAGAVTGSSISSTGNNHPFLWTEVGGLQDLGTLSGSDTYGIAINDQGTIAGYGYDGLNSAYTHGFQWTASKGFRKLDNLFTDGYAASYIYGIDQRNRVIGYSADQFPTVVVATLWAGGNVYDLSSISGDSSFSGANGIGDNLLVVGQSGQSPSDAVVWSLTGGITYLPSLPGTTLAWATAVNKHGTMIVGNNSSGVGVEAVAWTFDPSSQQYLLNDVGPGQAYAINDVCQVVGRSGQNRAFIWTPSQGAVDLNTLIPPGSGVILAYPYGINDAGQIVGQTAYDNHQRRVAAFVLTPAQ